MLIAKFYLHNNILLLTKGGRDDSKKNRLGKTRINYFG